MSSEQIPREMQGFCEAQLSELIQDYSIKTNKMKAIGEFMIAMATSRRRAYLAYLEAQSKSPQV